MRDAGAKGHLNADTHGWRRRRGLGLKMPFRPVPKEGWLVFFLVMAMGLTLAWSVEQGDWVETQGLVWIVVAATVAGLILAKTRLVYPAAILAGLAVGFLMVLWQGSTLTESVGVTEQTKEMWHRVQDWFEAAFSGGISIDLLPFSLILLSIGWLLGFFVSWLLFRHGNVWLAIVPMAIAILTNLSYMPSDARSNTPFFFFLLAALLLVIRMNTFKETGKKREADIDYSGVRGWASMSNAIWFSVIVVALTAFLPFRVFTYGPLKGVWNELRSPAVQLEGEFTRLMSGIAAQKPTAFRTFGENLPFQGKLALSSNVAFWAESTYNSYWVSRTYSVYTPQGWLRADVRPLTVGGERQAPPPSQESKSRTRIAQEVQVGFDTQSVFAGGNLAEVNKSAVVYTLAPRSFALSMQDPSKDSEFPPDIQELSRAIRAELEGDSDLAPEVIISRLLGEDVVLQEFEVNDNGAVATVMVGRKAPVVSEVVSTQFPQRLTPGEAYTMTSAVSLATEEELRGAHQEYPPIIFDYYLQLPEGLSPRIGDLAREITEGAATPYDQAVLIQDYLREELRFSLKIDAPPFNVDGVTHFLFDSKEGYGDYFASAMALMIRTMGVPARVSAGYWPGTYDNEEMAFIVRDSDSHVWTQVYFPEYGWIDFEPTPVKPLPKRELILQDFVAGGGDVFDPEEELRPEEDDATFGLEGDFGALQEVGSSTNWVRVLSIPAYLLLGLGLLALAIRVLWNRSLASVPVVERPYVKMSRLAAIAVEPRKPQTTPNEYARLVAKKFPENRGETDLITEAFVKSRYGSKESPPPDEEELVETAWSGIRKTLAVGVVKRIFSLMRG